LSAAQRCSGIVGNAPLFTVLVNYRHGVTQSDASWERSEDIKALATRAGTNYPITLSIDDLGEAFQLTVQTDRRVDPQRIAAYLRTALESLVRALEEAPQTPTSALTILPASERRQLLEVLNPPASAYPGEKPIHQLFTEQATRTPDSMAVLHGSDSLTYRELNQRANQLARYLRAQGVQTDELVGICMERSIDLVVALLAIMKAGGAYVPLDPNYPTERLKYMLEDARPRVVLTQHTLTHQLPATAAQQIELDNQRASLGAYATTELGADELGAALPRLVYVIYTSGSTGQPKGTMMPHRAMVNLLHWHPSALATTSQQRVLQFAALSFDVAFQEMFSTLCNGDTLVMLDEYVRRDTPELVELLRRQAVNRMFLPPLMLQSLVDYVQNTDALLPALHDVITAGEQLRISPEIRQFFERHASCRLHNHYGPTETHVVTALTLTDPPARWPTLPSIGRPIANTRIYILDGQHQPVPLGASGEVFIAGANVALGYLRRAELTKARFVPDPFAGEPHARMYKTGDLGRWREEDGTIEYLGRNDDQVKIRGFRIELGEIETQLALHEHVRDAAVVMREDAPGVKRLVAYVTATPDGAASAAELRAHLKGRLPDHMIPSAFVALENLPQTPSGKLNRRGLPVPDLDGHTSEHQEPPSGEVERAVAAIWEKLLGVQHVSRDDNFFELGGHSLLVLEALAQINRKLNSKLRVTDFYRKPMLRDLAELIQGGTVEDPLIDLHREARLEQTIVPTVARQRTAPKAVLLTGATGFVGRFLLAQLIEDTDATIYCLVRAQSPRQAAQRLQANQQQWQLWSEQTERRIIAIPGDLRVARLGLDDVTYDLLAREVDSVYHCATSMNHLETYSMAKAANVDSARELLAFGSTQRLKLINFISTLGVFGPADVASSVTRTVDESTSIEGEWHRSSAGYVGSKWVGEKIFLTASDRGFPCNIFRLGLIWADTVMGRYDELQHDYRLIKSCLLSGFGIANHRYFMAPTPVDDTARAIVHLADRHSEGGGVFHISAARTQIDGVFERCNEILGTQLELLPLYDWIFEMKRLHENGQSVPVIPLIQWAFSMSREAFDERQRQLFARRVSFDCRRTRQELAEMGAEISVVDDRLLQLCLEHMVFRDDELAEALPERVDGWRIRAHETSSVAQWTSRR
jgi:myxalamid-type nonribosomal peptide synthetase MxaA